MLVEKRRIQRVKFDVPVAASLGDVQVSLCDVSSVGARIEHLSGFLPGGTFTFKLVWRNRRFEARAKVTRCRLGRSQSSTLLRYQCGLRFVDMNREARALLHELIEDEIGSRPKQGERAAVALAYEPAPA